MTTRPPTNTSRPSATKERGDDDEVEVEEEEEEEEEDGEDEEGLPTRRAVAVSVYLINRIK